MAGRPGKYYRAGHWVSRPGGRRRPGPKPLTGAGLLGVIGIIVLLMAISHGGGAGATPAQGPSATPTGTAATAR
ncbi:hypothetical protein [Kitasatospora sp. LaBMicrA B282]|uniref:hypothetical protein n=1 Tax=Kitasatospora sp. LaBMicrA B282 TaxID=3420949 RepID=UPI003D13A2FE